MRFFNKLSEKTGLTQTELKVIAFLIAVFLFGSAIKLFKWEKASPVINNFDYSASDSIFYSANAIKAEILENKVFDSNQESSDFNKSNFIPNTKKQKLAENSIDLNKASLEELTLLPGIGEKTAEKILAFRKASGRFNNIDELLEVRGIGESKLEKIKKYIFVR